MMEEELYLIRHDDGTFQLMRDNDAPFETWEFLLVKAIKDSPHLKWLGQGKFTVGGKQ